MPVVQEMPIFTRTFDLLTWLLPVTNNFPRAHRHTATKRLLDAAFDLREHLQAANARLGKERLSWLDLADQDLDRLKRKKGIYYQRKLRSLLGQYASGDLPLETVTASVQGWVNHVRYGNTVGLRKAVLGGTIPPREE